MSEETNRLRDRPDAPDPRVLADAARSLAELGGGGDSGAITWDIRSRIERPRSTLFQVRAQSSQGGAVDAYYKVSKPPPYEGERRTRWEGTVRSGLTRALVLDQRLAGLFEGEGLAFSRALAVEPDSLTVVTLAVPGRAMGKVWRHLLPGRSRVDAFEILRRAGRAAWLIEECTVEPVEVDPSLASVIQRRLARVRDVVPPTTLRGHRGTDVGARRGDDQVASTNGLFPRRLQLQQSPDRRRPVGPHRLHLAASSAWIRLGTLRIPSRVRHRGAGVLHSSSEASPDFGLRPPWSRR